MSAFFNSDGSFPLQFAFIFGIIFLVLAGLVIAYQRLAGRGLSLSAKAGQRGRQPRLGIVDIYELDRQRQLILLRRDNVEHLLLVGGPNDVVVERNINRGVGNRLATDEIARGEPAPERLPAEPVRTFEAPAFAAMDGATQAMPVPDASAMPAPAREVDFEPKAPERPRRAEAVAPFTRRAPPQLANLKAEAAERSGKSSGTPVEQAVPLPVPVTPDAAAGNAMPAATADWPVPPVAGETPPLPPEERDRADTAPEAPLPPKAPLPPQASRGPARPVDAAILSDMARQLEEALRRPSSAIAPSAPAMAVSTPPKAEPFPEPKAAPPEPKAESAPAPATTPKASPEPKPEPEPQPQPLPKTVPDAPVFVAEPAASEPKAVVVNQAPAAPEPPPSADAPIAEPQVDPIAAAMAASLDAPVAEATTAEPPPPVPPEPFLPAPPPPEPVTKGPVVAKEQLVAKEPASRPPSAIAQNPFSVEEIEAEFARLLGRPLDRRS